MQRRLAVVSACAGALACGAPLVSSAHEAEAPDPIAKSLADMRERDQKLLDIGWRLRTGNAQFCEDAVPDIGLLLLDTGSFRDPSAIREALGVPWDILVQATATGSPASEAGLRSPMPIISVDGELTAVPVAIRPYDWSNLALINRRIDASLKARGKLRIFYREIGGLHRSTTIVGTPACNARMEPRDGEDSARADGNRILIGSDFPGFAYPEDEFAAAIAHELAHIVLGHSAWLDANGRGRRNVRLTEREADRLAPWLLANAGYDPLAAGRFMRRWGPEYGGGLLRKRTHAGWDERAELMDAEALKTGRARGDGGPADWSRRFVRDLPAE